jgi:hypothetical protein
LIRHSLALATGALAGVMALSLPGLAYSQETTGADTAWNSPRPLALMALARERRRQPLADTNLRDYQARAEGIVYFYLDRRDAEERILVRTDQVGLEVYWAQPDRTKQRIVGMRGENSLPNRMLYHLDHLTVVQNGFGNLMRMGDGDEVRDVPHPAAPGSDSIYDYRLTDSLALRLPGATEPIKAYEISVRPRRTDRPAFVGSVFVDHATGDIVRMTFTFTRASYVDPRLDFINIALDNSLWRGRYWLPYEQSVEIRRQVPELDFVVTSVIQARFRVWNYEFNQDLPDNLFWGYRVTTVPEEQRKRYAFDRAIYDDLHDAGLAPPPELKELRARAVSLVRERALSGLPRLRLSLPNASSAFRYNRAESLYLGWGGSFTPGTTRFEAVAGYAFGPEHTVATAGVEHAIGSTARLRGAIYLNELRDIGVRPGMPGALNTLSAFWGDDFLDAFYASGARITLDRSVAPRWRLQVGLFAERQRSASLELETPLFSSSVFRPVRMAEGGTAVGLSLHVKRDAGDPDGFGWGGSGDLSTGTFAGRGFAIPQLEIDLVHDSRDRRTQALARIATGYAIGSPAPQQTFLLGGRNTLPGYDYRTFGGDAFGLANLEIGRDIYFPIARARLLGSAGWTAVSDPDAGSSTPRIPVDWSTHETSGIRTSLGAGLGLFYDMLHLDLVRGLGTSGRWQFLVSLDSRLWPVL